MLKKPKSSVISSSVTSLSSAAKNSPKRHVVGNM